ncbi:hypothetical protein NC653_039494 [Populus alba x Populus x berolinensis]|uniref:Uncharacterized protein n=1 Tax=Populus alba x Populus x berolinensis TaxID=444605 RepID=A0AAD6PRE0_9ROSI|nr:hypothetical protein NC653_039494 [Populus alba x Populus x berolinensis]
MLSHVRAATLLGSVAAGQLLAMVLF